MIHDIPTGKDTDIISADKVNAQKYPVIQLQADLLYHRQEEEATRI